MNNQKSHSLQSNLNSAKKNTLIPGRLIMYRAILIVCVLLIGCGGKPEERTLPEYAHANFNNPEAEGGYTRIKMPWGYVAPDISYQSEAELQKLKKLAKLFRMDYETKKNNKEPSDKLRITRVFSIDALLPDVIPKNYSNIDQFLEGDNRLRILVQSAGRIDGKPIQKNMNIKYRLSVENFLRQIKKKDINYYQGTEYGLNFYKVVDEDKNMMRSRGDIEALIPDAVYYTDLNGDAQRVLICQDESRGYLCKHYFYLHELNARVHVGYSPHYLKSWKDIEFKIQKKFVEFIALGKEGV